MRTINAVNKITGDTVQGIIFNDICDCRHNTIGYEVMPYDSSNTIIVTDEEYTMEVKY